MTKPCRKVNVNGTTYFRELISSSLKIVIGQRGWIFVGYYSENNEVATIKNASVVRRWGTAKGLGELAVNGPLQNTKLDSCPTVKIPLINVLATIDCEESKWQ